MMPWGWRHAYLNDPDGHEISLYWAGEKPHEENGDEGRAKGCPGLTPVSRKPTVPSNKPEVERTILRR
jgi:hypothetical protein